MQNTTKIYLVSHTGEHIALVADGTSVLTHLLLTAPSSDIQIIIRICYVCLMSIVPFVTGISFMLKMKLLLRIKI